MGDGVVGGFCVERSHAARRHAQRCGAPKAPLKGELAARNALSEGFCGRASGAWSNNALPTSLLLRKTSQSASLTAPLSGEPLAFAALRVTTSSVALVDAVGRRPRWSCVIAAVRKRKRSGKRPAHQAARRIHAQAYLVVETTPPATRTPSFFPYSFFFADHARIYPPEGPTPTVWKCL